MSAGDNMVPRHDRMLHMARAAKPRGRYDLSPKQIIMARHMANDGADLGAVMLALGWACSRREAAARLLSKYRIRPNGLRGHPHRGDFPYLPPNGERVDFASYRPKQVRT